ncbi:lytic murein transglycosylase [Sphingobium boeckii]|uniref:Lytic murein transglycosylase n=1 Tax=Sphingobium boeckii TaxID=1082345 RepID=A0A7W9AKN9_9SPHN|nr:lytic murein transglycosylase [Sphingobium boeckii]MBB5687313.1 lytic murein transglycosylase [Sphingobium boeckii]
MFKRKSLMAVALSLMLPMAGWAMPAQAQSEEGFQSFLNGLRGRAQGEGISRTTLDAVLPTLTFNPRVIALDKAQPGSDTTPSVAIGFAAYKRSHVDSARISRGHAKYVDLRPRLERIERETGVPEEIMLAIYGHETNYGGYTGNFDLLRSLASLAYDGRRRDLFTTEFLATLKMIDRGVSRSQLVGSWAGATGYPQFLPSVYIKLARDGDGDGRADIWSNETDALASIANYFVMAGWRPGSPWGVAATVPAGFNRAAIATKLVAPRCPRVFSRHSQWKSMAEWRRLGVLPQPGAAVIRDDEQAALMEPDGPGTPAYLLTGNYRVILEYNCSNLYALSVGLLADEIKR